MLYSPDKSIWYNPNIEYLFNNEIIEYDLKDAGLNIIKEYKLLSISEINRLESLGKGFNRHKEIGLLQRNDKEFSQRLLDKFTHVRGLFIESNKLNDNNIISVKKDAFFIIGNVNNTKFGNLEFRSKNSYSSYLRFPSIQNLEIYYNNHDPSFKGIGDNAINKHRLYLYTFILDTIKMIENNSSSLKRKMIKFISDYKYNLLDEEFYLEFNNRSNDLDKLFNYKNLIIPLVQMIQKEVN